MQDVRVEFGSTDTRELSEAQITVLKQGLQERITACLRMEADALSAIRNRLAAIMEVGEPDHTTADELMEAMEEQTESLRDELEIYVELAQLGMAVGVVQHDFADAIKTIRSDIRALQPWQTQTGIFSRLHSSLRTAFEHLDGYLTLFTPLNKRLYRKSVTIRGENIALFLDGMFAERLEGSDIHLLSTDSFREHEIEGFPSTFFPAFVNLVENARYWVEETGAKPGKIVLDADGDDLTISDTGPGVSPRDRDAIFRVRLYPQEGRRTRIGVCSSPDRFSGGPGGSEARPSCGREGSDLQIGTPRRTALTLMEIHRWRPMSFEAFCEGVARNFIQTVIVVDDRARLTELVPLPPPTNIMVPPGRTFATRPPDEREPTDATDPVPATPLPAAPSHELNGMRLTRSFAKLGVTCGIYVPEQADSNEAEDVDDTVAMARHADVVVLDWQLGSDSNKARKIIRRILAQDGEENGRLRLIAVYTGEINLPTLREQVRLELLEAGIDIQSTDVDGSVALRGPSLKIVFLNKDRPGLPLGSPGLDETSLPSRLVTEFAEMSRGIMPAVALGSITAIRNSTHHVLAKFHARLDGALATHRVLIDNPEDAEIYAADLVAEELRTILEVTGVGAANAGIEVFENWVTYLAGTGHKFLVSASATDGLTPSSATKLLKSGVSGHEEARNSLKPVLGKDKFVLTALICFTLMLY